MFLPIVLFKSRLGIEDTPLARPAVHKKVDPRFCPRGQIGLPGLQVIDSPVARRQSSFSGGVASQETHAAVKVLAEQRGERRSINAIGDPLEKVAPADFCCVVAASIKNVWGHGSPLLFVSTRI